MGRKAAEDSTCYDGWTDIEIEQHRERSRKGMRKYKDDPDYKRRNKERAAKYREDNLEAKREYGRLYYRRNREKILAECAARYQKKKKERAEWYQQNKRRLLDLAKIRYAEKRDKPRCI